MPGRHPQAAKPRKFAPLLAVAALIAAVSPLSIWSPASASVPGTLPSNFFTVTDADGANDVPGQSDLTQFGRDDSTAGVLKMAWDWDATDQWTGTGQTGNACALFDTDGDGNINYSVCVQIHNTNASTVAQISPGSPVVYQCSDSKNDRCGSPVSTVSFTASQLKAGVLGPPAGASSGNLIDGIDPFSTGSNYPNDSVVEVDLDTSAATHLLPLTAVMTNVCSYPSNGSGANNNPFDCVANPGGGFLVIHKNDHIDSTTSFPFTIDPGNTTVSVTGTGDTDPQSLLIGTGYSFSETVPAGWIFKSATCTLSDGSPIGNASGTGVTDIEIQSGKTTTCDVDDVKQHPSISLDKSSTATSVPAVGQSIPYSLVATNDGNVDLTNVQISDPTLGTLTGCTPALGSTLHPTDTMTCTGSYTVQQSDIDAGHVNNTATATGTPPTGSDVTDTDSVNLSATQTPDITMAKSANPTTYDKQGDTITYTLTETNSGNVTLTDAHITDPLFGAGAITSPCTLDGNSLTVAQAASVTLAPGHILECKPVYTILQSDVDAGSVANTVTGHGTDPNNQSVSDTANANIVANNAPSFSIAKDAKPSTYSKVGDVIDYTITVTNDGNLTLSSVSIDDNKLSSLSCTPYQPATLAPTDTLVCTGKHTITQADLDAGSIHNTATGHASVGANPLTDKTASATVNASQSKAISLTKTPDPTTYDKVGDPIGYTLVATNTGNVTLHDVKIEDSELSNISCTPNSANVILAPGEHLDCTGDYTIVQADMDRGFFTNTATATGSPPSGTDVTDTKQATVTTTQTPQIGLTKTPSTNVYDHVGQKVDYTLVATNTGNVTLHDVTVTDAKVGTLTCTPNTSPLTLAPTDSVSCTGTYTITQADLDNGSFTNTGHTEGSPPAGKAVFADAPATIQATQSPAITMTKTPNPTSFSAVGQTINYTVSATNTGNVTLTDFSINDPLLGGVMTSCVDGSAAVINPIPEASFAPGAVMTCAGSYPTTSADARKGSVDNIATGSGTDPNNQSVSQTATASVPFIPPPPPPGSANLGVTKTSVPASGSFVKPGDQIVYTLAYTNTGTAAGTTVVASDALPADLDYVVGSASNGGTYDATTRKLSWQIGNVAPGGSGTVSFTAVVANTATNGEVLSNVAVLTAPGVTVPSNPDDVTVSVPSGDLTLTKAVDKSVAEFGDTLTYSVNVVASGKSDQTNVVITDSVPDKTTYVDGSAACDSPCTASESGGVVTWNVGSLATGASTIVTFKVTIDTPSGDASGAIPAETIRNVALGSSDLDPSVESNPVKTDITAVLGEVHHRHHQVKGEHGRLPFTGLPLLRLLLMAAGAVGLGSWLVARARTRRALAGGVPPSEG